MRGYPKHLNSKADVDYCLEHYPTETKKQLQGLLDKKEAWITTAKLADKEKGVTDDTHRIVEIKDDKTQEVIERYQEEFKVDPKSQIFSLGLTVEKVEEKVRG